jgi:pimeloyl-ACP methyl ester carboxylesterase
VVRRFLTFLVLAVAAGGCAASREEVRYAPPRPPARGVVFGVDGAGDFHEASDSLRRAIDECGVPLEVETVVWSHGYARIVADEIDYGYARAQGRCLAARVCAYRQNCPGGEIYLVGYSAGSAVLLAAVEALPPGSVDRIILLAPSVSADYDLRPALRCARQGVEVFYSYRDRFYLGLAVGVLGTADRRDGPAAGRVGFAPTVATPEDTVLLAKLRQHPWTRCLEWTGNTGGHYGTHEVCYLRAFVVPLLQR